MRAFSVPVHSSVLVLTWLRNLPDSPRSLPSAGWPAACLGEVDDVPFDLIRGAVALPHLRHFNPLPWFQTICMLTASKSISTV